MTTILTLTLALASAAFAGEVNVTEKGHASNPSWSPDGQYLAFEVNDFSGRIGLYVAKMGGESPMGSPTKITLPGGGSQFGGGGSVLAAPTWHPDGLLIFEGSNSGGTSRLYFWQPGGAAASELLSVGQVSGDLSWPAISADGMNVTFVSDATGNGDLYQWERASNKVSQLASSNFSEMAPRYSASGEVAYSRKNQGGEDLFIFSNGQSIPRAGGNGDQSRPIWSGDKIVFFSNERGDDKWDIAVSAGPGDKKTVAKDVRLPIRAAPALSPDGQWVAFGYNDPEKASKVGMVRLDGTKSATIDTGLVACGEPALVQAGGRTYLAFTALPGAGADWRQLHIIDVTSKL